jgi:tetratricopeptide (TPR) repeat protein
MFRNRFARGIGSALTLAILSGLTGCLPAYENRLSLLREQGEYAQADELLAHAETQDPQNPAIARERGILAFEQGDHEQAIRFLERALTLAPEDGRAALYIAAATELAGRSEEAVDRYRRAETIWAGSPELRDLSPVLSTELTCHRRSLDTRRLGALVKSRLAGEQTTSSRPRILCLPPVSAGGSDVGLSLRLGLASLLATDLERAPAIEPVPFQELLAFLDALKVPLDAPIDAELAERLAVLTGARFVVDGTMSEHNDLVSVAAIITDREAKADSREQRIEYQQSRIATLLEMEKKLLFRLTSALGLALTPEQQDELGQFASQSGLAVVLYGEALRLKAAGNAEEAAERLDRALSLDPGFHAAREARIDLTYCQSSAGEPEALLQTYETALRAADEEARRRMLLSEAVRENGRLGGPEGEGEDLSLNRPLGAGSVSIPVQLPR